MPSNSAEQSLEMGRFKDLTGAEGERFQRSLNDKLRRISAALSRTGLGAAGRSNSTLTNGMLILSVPGTLAIQSSVAPLVRFPEAVTPIGIVALLKQGPQGGTVQARLKVAGADYFTISIAESATVASVTQTFAQIAKEGTVSLDLIGVGTTFPGADLSVMVRF